MARRQVQAMPKAKQDSIPVIEAAMLPSYTLRIGDVDYEISFNYNVQGALQRLWGKEPYKEFIKHFTNPGEQVDMLELRDLIWAMFKDAGWDGTPREIGMFLSRVSNINKIVVAMQHLVRDSLIEQDETENPIAAAQ